MTTTFKQVPGISGAQIKVESTQEESSDDISTTIIQSPLQALSPQHKIVTTKTNPTAQKSLINAKTLAAAKKASMEQSDSMKTIMGKTSKQKNVSNLKSVKAAQSVKSAENLKPSSMAALRRISDSPVTSIGVTNQSINLPVVRRISEIQVPNTSTLPVVRQVTSTPTTTTVLSAVRRLPDTAQTISRIKTMKTTKEGTSLLETNATVSGLTLASPSVAVRITIFIALYIM